MCQGANRAPGIVRDDPGPPRVAPRDTPRDTLGNVTRVSSHTSTIKHDKADAKLQKLSYSTNVPDF